MHDEGTDGNHDSLDRGGRHAVELGDEIASPRVQGSELEDSGVPIAEIEVR